MIMIREGEVQNTQRDKELTEVLKTLDVAHLDGKEIWKSSQMNKSEM